MTVLATPAVERAPRTAPFRAGLAVVGILLVAANLRASITVVGPLLGDVRADLGLSSFTASALIGLPLLAFAAFSPVAPGLARRIGLERALGVALVALAVGIVARSVPWLPALWVGTALLGLGIAVLNVLLPALVKRDFPGHAGRVTGAYSAAQSAFAAAASGLAVPLAGSSPDGWRLAFGVWAGLAVVGVAVFAPALRRAPQHATPGTTNVPAETAATGADRPWSPWRSPLAWVITLSMALQSALFYVIVAWWPSVEAAHGTSEAAAGAHQSVLQVTGVVGNVVAAWAIHRWHRDQRVLVAVLVALNAVGIGGMLVAPGLAILWSLVLGISCGGMIVFALAAFGLRTRSHHHAAALSGMAQSAGYLLAALGPAAIGALHDLTGSWTAPLVVLLALQPLQLLVAWQTAKPRYVA